MHLALFITGIVVASLFMLAALFFSIIPLLPGTIFVIPGVVAYGLIVDWEPFGTGFWVGQIILTIVNFLSDNVAQVFGIKKMGGSKAGMVGGTIGMFVLPIFIGFLGPLAVILGPLLGAVLGAMLGEWLVHRKSTDEVMKIGWGSALSFLAGTFFKFMLVGVQIVWFFLAVF
ncbi:MAG TPA: DUF456 domain-containing protein [Bacilli bacterium]|nr:DUF456 domain-containing protein [Bacilli bacterium]